MATKRIAAVPDGIRLNLLTDMTADKPSIDQYDAWCQLKGAEYKIDPDDVRKVFAHHLEQVEFGAKIQARSTAQKVASAIGATLTEGLTVIRESLKATKPIIKCDRNGKVIHSEERPDWDARLTGTKELFRIHGAYAPDEVKIEHGISEQLADLTEAQLMLKVLELTRVMESDPDFRKAAEELERTGSRTAGGRGGTEGPPSGAGLLLLADGMHDHDRRAGHEEPIQAVPEAAVHEAAPRLSGERPGA